MKILECYSGKNIGQDLLELAARHAKAFQSKIMVVTSLTGGDKTTHEKVQEAEQNLEGGQEFFYEQQLVCKTHLLVRGMTASEDIVLLPKSKMRVKSSSGAGAVQK